MEIIKFLREKRGVLIGMVHCLPMPGCLNYGGSVEAIVEKAVADAKNIEAAGFDAVMVEPTLDKPTGIERGPLQVSAMAIVCDAVRRAVNIPVGLSFMTKDCKDVFSIAKASGADFIRLNVFVDTVAFSAGVVYPCAVRAWEIRSAYDCKDIAILADIQVKHARMIYPDVTIEESARLAQSQGADAVVVTGSSTGQETPIDTIKRVKEILSIPVVVGSGACVSNIGYQMEHADGFIVGSSIKKNGDLRQPVDFELAHNLAQARDNA